MANADRSRESRAGLAGLAAVAGVVAASSCCLPLFPFVLGAAFAGSSAFLSAARPYLLGASVAFIGWGFYQGFRVRQCNRRPGAIGAALLWLSAIFVGAAIFFPQAMANAAADLLTKAPPGNGHVANLTARNVRSVAAAFNSAKSGARVLLFFSPT